MLSGGDAVPGKDFRQSSSVEARQRVQPINAGRRTTSLVEMKPAGGNGEVTVAQFLGKLRTRAMYVAQTHSKFFADAAEASTGTASMCHLTYLSASPARTLLILSFHR